MYDTSEYSRLVRAAYEKEGALNLPNSHLSLGHSLVPPSYKVPGSSLLPPRPESSLPKPSPKLASALGKEIPGLGVTPAGLRLPDPYSVSHPTALELSRNPFLYPYSIT